MNLIFFLLISFTVLNTLLMSVLERVEYGEIGQCPGNAPPAHCEFHSPGEPFSGNSGFDRGIWFGSLGDVLSNHPGSGFEQMDGRTFHAGNPYGPSNKSQLGLGLRFLVSFGPAFGDSFGCSVPGCEGICSHGVPEPDRNLMNLIWDSEQAVPAGPPNRELPASDPHN